MNDYLDQINVKGVLYTISGGAGSGVTPAEVQEMIDQSISGLSGDTHIISGDVITISGDVITISEDVIELAEKVDKVSVDVTVLSDDVSALETKTDALSGALDDKQDKLISGTNIKTINGQSLLGSGDIEISGGSESKAIIAGRGIKVTSGDTADTVAFDMPITDTKPSSTGFWDGGYIKVEKPLAIGVSSWASMPENGKFAVSQNNGDVSYANDFVINGDGRIFIDDYHSRGRYGVRSIYCLQDKLDSLQPILSAGTGIDITDNVISVTGGGESSAVTVLSGDVITISGDVIELAEKVDNVSGDVIVVSGDVKGLETKIDALSGKVDDKQDKLVSGVNIKTINNQSLLGSGNITISGGSGSTYTAGRGIDISSGNVISFNLPISAGTSTNSVAEGNSTADGDYSHAEGFLSRAKGMYSHAEGASGAFGNYSHAEGSTLVGNDYEHASGIQNKAVKNSNNFGDSGNTLFTVGNGSESVRHNAIEIMQNGDIYIPDTNASGEYYEKPMIKLQDALGGGGASGVTSGEVQDMLSAYTYDKITIDEHITSAITEAESDIYDIVDNAVSADTEPIKNDITLIKTSAVTNAYYDSVNKVINFYNISGTVVDSIDATDFIKDGMIEDVEIITSGGTTYLRITFNTESGHENIDIDLSSIFDANNYYTKTEVNNLISNKIQCLSEAEWAVQSGSTQADTLYLIY